MIESTFQLARGIGPARERALWMAGLVRWGDLRGAAAAAVGAPLRDAIDRASVALAARDAGRLATLVPPREHWRLFAAFADQAAYLDIETSDDVVGRASIAAVGVLDGRGPRQLLAGRDLDDFPDVAAGWPVLVTFNGGSFDLPILRAAFPGWRPPACHIDLRHVLARLGLEGGLKAIERRLGGLHLARPPELDGLDGAGACWLYRRGRDGDRAALRTFAAYNLYDTVNLRTLMAWAYNQMVEREAERAPALRGAVATVTVPERGDVLYDVSKLLLAL